MKNSTASTKTSNLISSARFTSLTLVDNGLILTDKKKEETILLLSELDKIYIRKRQFNGLNKLLFVLVLFLPMLITIHFLPIEGVFFVSFAIVIPLFAKMNAYKWYQLCLDLKGGASYTKVFYKTTKQEHITLVAAVKKKFFHYYIQSTVSTEEPMEVGLGEAIYALSNLNIA